MSALRIDVADLLAHHGARRSVYLEVAVEDLAVSGVKVEEPLVLDLLLERVPEGIVVRGTVTARWESECSTCLRELAADIDVSVTELFERNPVDGETYPVDGHLLELEQLVRDAVLLDLPLVPTCASLGLAECHADLPQPGEPEVDLDLDDDAHADDVPADAPVDAPVDSRWAVLSELEL